YARTSRCSSARSLRTDRRSVDGARAAVRARLKPRTMPSVRISSGTNRSGDIVLWCSQLRRSRSTAHRVVDCVDQEACRKWLAQIRDTPRGHRRATGCFILDRGDENDGEPGTGVLQSALQLDPGYAPQMDVQNQASELMCAIARQERLGRGKRLQPKPVRFQQ